MQQVERVAKITTSTAQHSYVWRGEVVCTMMDDLLDGRVDFSDSDKNRDMNESLELQVCEHVPHI
jgi:hypothetical protein